MDEAPVFAGAFFMGEEDAMVAKKEIAPELLAEARRLYEQTLAPVDDIAAMLGLSRTPFYRRVKEGGWRGRRASVGTFEFARAMSGGTVTAILAASEPAEQARAAIDVSFEPITAQQRFAMAQRIMAVAERAIDAADRIAKVIKPKDQMEAEHGARTLASVSRSLREIKVLTEPDEVTAPDDADDAIPLDIDELRNELARRIQEFVEAERGSAGEVRG